MIKLIEKIILNKMNSDQGAEKIHPAQVGGEKGLDCGVNILRLLTSAKMYKKKFPNKFQSAAVVFLDFSSAFDNVDWRTLFSILKKQKVPKNIIDTLKILYYNIKVNGCELGKGLLQGFLTSPEVFKRLLNAIVP